MIVTYSVIFIALILMELLYFKIADHFNIIDKPNERSSHSTIVLRGGGIIFALSIFAWLGLQAAHGDINVIISYTPFFCGLALVAGVSFVDDIHPLPYKVRLAAQFVAAGLAFYQLGLLNIHVYRAFIFGLIIYAGITNVVNFMDGINGITGGYSLVVLVSLFILNNIRPETFVLNSFLGVSILSVIVFCIFNFRPKGKAKCFAGDVGSIGIAYIMLYALTSLIVISHDMAWLTLMVVYGIDACLTICHRIMLHEHLGEAHRKHAYQIMANELKIGHVKVASFYCILQLIISLIMIFVIPDTIIAHWIYMICVIIVLSIAYVLFMKKYYHLHEEYLANLKK